MSPVGSCKNQGTRPGYKLLSGRYQLASWSKAEDSTGLRSLRAPWRAPTPVPNRKPAPLARALGQPHSRLSQKDWRGRGAQSACAVSCKHLSAENTFQLLRSCGAQECKHPLASRTRQSRDGPWVAAAKTREPRVKTRVPDVCKGSVWEDTGTLGCC